MFSHTKIKWTIDSEKSEIFFKERCIVLSGCKDLKLNIQKENSIDDIYCYPFFFNKITGCEKTQEFENREESEMKLRAIEYHKKINYNLVLFEEKNSKEFWKRNTFAGLLILNDSDLNVLITLHKKRHDFDSNGAASATYFVKGELNKNELYLDSEKEEENGTTVLTLYCYLKAK